MKKRLLMASLLSIGLSATTYGHVTAPIPVIPQRDFQKVVISSSIPIILDSNAKNEFSTPKPTFQTKNTPKIEFKADLKPKITISGTEKAKIAKKYALSRIGATQFACLDKLFTRESHWRWNALNHSSGAYGIPQALPGSKMAKAGADWRTNPVTQVKWGLTYIKSRYGTACGAWNHSQRTGWY